jgi:hypothetical protein
MIPAMTLAPALAGSGTVRAAPAMDLADPAPGTRRPIEVYE